MKAAIYLRVSRPDETDILRNQGADAMDYANRLDLPSPAIYDDIASGGDDDRPGWNALMADLRAGDLVIFTSLSRMTRGGVGTAWDILRQLEARGVGWHFVEQQVLNYDAGTPKLVRDVILAVLAAVDEDYRRRIAQATRSAYRRRTALAGSGATVKDWRPPRGPDKRPRKRRSPSRPRVGTRIATEGASLAGKA